MSDESKRFVIKREINLSTLISTTLVVVGAVYAVFAYVSNQNAETTVFKAELTEQNSKIAGLYVQVANLQQDFTRSWQYTNQRVDDLLKSEHAEAQAQQRRDMASRAPVGGPYPNDPPTDIPDFRGQR